MRIFIMGLGALLLAAVGVQFVRTEKSATRSASRLKEIPISAPGWTSISLPLGATENETNAVSDTLRYDDVLFREYRSGDVTFSLYVAYWTPGKMPTQLVSAHTPDYCWTAVGWQCTAMRHRVRLTVGGHSLQPAQHRTFAVANRADQHVVYWHLVGQEVYDYGNRFNAVPSAWRWWRDVVRQFYRAPEGQYFIRLSSSRRLEEIEKAPAFRAVVGALAQLGLAEKLH